MADNGHCSTCQIYNNAYNCISKQDFKTKIGEKISDNESYIKINSIFPATSQYVSYSSTEIWNKINDILQYIKDYGEKGDRNPTQIEIDKTKAVKNNITFLQYYNDILSALDKNIISGTNFISKSLIDSLKTYIQNYSLDSNRCNICNTSGNCPGCQSDCCDNYSDCTYNCMGGDGGGDGACYCTCSDSVGHCEIAGDSYGPCWASGDS